MAHGDTISSTKTLKRLEVDLSLSATTPTSLVAAQGADVKARIVGGHLTISGAALITIDDGTAEIWRLKTSGAGVYAFDLDDGLDRKGIVGAANTAIRIESDTGSIDVDGYLDIQTGAGF